jgi:hypothetical protein
MPDDRDKPGQTNNPMAGLQSMLGPQPGQTPAASPPMQQPQAPAGTGAGMAFPQSAPPAPAPSQAMNPIVQSMMGQAQGAMSNPMGQAVPQGGGGLIDVLKHPLVGAIIKALAQGAQSYGWTAMQPSERLERTQLNQQKAETLSRLAETGAYQGANLDIREQQTGIRQQQANTQQAGEQSLAEHRATMDQISQSKQTLLEDANKWKQATAQGRLDVAHAALDQRAKQFEELLQVRIKQVGVQQARLELGEEANQIRSGMLDVAKSAVAQRGTVAGAGLQEKINSWDKEHWVLSSLFGGLGDISGLAGGAGQAGIPGVSPTQSPIVAQPSTTPAPQGKAAAKAKQNAPSSGGTHYYFDSQGNMVTQPNAR